MTLLDRRGALHLDHLSGSINLARIPVQQALSAHARLSTIGGLVQQQAQALAFGDAFYMLGAVTLVLMPLVFLLRAPKRASHA